MLCPAHTKLVKPGQNIIKRQRQAIEKIRKENERLKEQLKAESQQNAAATEGNTVSMIAGEHVFHCVSSPFTKSNVAGKENTIQHGPAQ